MMMVPVVVEYRFGGDDSSGCISRSNKDSEISEISDGRKSADVDVTTMVKVMTGCDVDTKKTMVLWC